MTKRDCHRQQQNKLAFIPRGKKKSVSDFRPPSVAIKPKSNSRRNRVIIKIKEGRGGVGMARVLIPEGGLHSSRY